MVEDVAKQNKFKQICKSRFSQLILVFAVADVALISYISFGYIVPSRIQLPSDDHLLGRVYVDSKAKPSPFLAAKPEPRQKAKVDIPVIDATSVAASDAAARAFLNTSATSGGAHYLVGRPASLRQIPTAAPGMQYATDPPQPVPVTRPAIPANSQGWNSSGQPAATDSVEVRKGATT